MELRRYLYGNLTESTLKKYLNGTYKILEFKGIMSFYPLINDIDQLKELDRWLLCTIIKALRRRKKELLLLSASWNSNQSPYNLSKDQLLEQCKIVIINERKGLLEIPSFIRIHNAIQIGLKNEGIDRVMNPSSGYYE